MTTMNLPSRAHSSRSSSGSQSQPYSLLSSLHQAEDEITALKLALVDIKYLIRQGRITEARDIIDKYIKE